MSLKVLICDTDWRFVERATQFLIGHGHQVMSEALPSEAVDLARCWRPDVLVLASESAEGPNAELLGEIQRINPRPAILLTGHLDRFDSAWRAWQKGGDELLLKPIIHAWELHTAIIAAMDQTAPKRKHASANVA
jgi:DNA-binding response OmpR family regulator